MIKNSLIIILFITTNVFSQDVYEVDTKYPVHELDTHLRVYADSLHVFTPETILRDSTMPFQRGDELPRLLKTNVTYWGKISIKTTDSLKGWKLHFQDERIGPPAWTKSNGKVDVYAYDGEALLFHERTGVEYPKHIRSTSDHWVLNSINLDAIPKDIAITLVIKCQQNSLGYPAYFNLSARSSSQPYYHQVYQFNNTFNIFMFGVTFIIFLYHFLQFVYLRDRVYFWFSLWLFVVMATHAMTMGIGISIPNFRYPLWLMIANGIFFTFWFFGRSFVDSKTKFPVLDKYILGLAFLVITEIMVVLVYVLLFSPERDFRGPGFHYMFLNLYAIGSLILSIVLSFKKDLFARYFGIGSMIFSMFLIIGSLWSAGVIKAMPFKTDPYATGMFFQIVIYSFGIAYRRQKFNKKSEEERLMAERSKAEVKRMKDLDEIKTRFFANISHEFRTPLALISGPIKSALKHDSNEDIIQLSHKHFEIINNNTDRLQNLVDQLLELSKIESGNVHLSLKQGGIIQFIRSIVFSFESMAERENISLNTSFPQELEHAFFDKDKLEKIVTNILSTTFKIRLPITLKYLPQEISMISESKPSKDIEKKRAYVENNDFNSVSTQESENLPVALLVEDNTDLQYYVSEIIKPYYNVKIAKDGSQGERMAFEHIPDIILSDVMMPKKDGYEMCNTLKTNTKTSHIPVIMLTAKAGQQNRIEGLTQGADAYLTKPFDEEELLLLMKNLVESRKNLWEHFRALDMLLVDEIEVISIDDKFLQDVFTTIKNNLDNEQFGVEDIARQVGFSRSQLHRKLKALSDKSANQLITEIRLNEAHRLLKQKTATVSEIAYAVGYSNLSYFTKSFKDKFGILPSKI